MASIGEITKEAVAGAESLTAGPQAETLNRPKKVFFGVFFDGTANNMIQQTDAERFRNKVTHPSPAPPPISGYSGSEFSSLDDWDLQLNDDLNEYGANTLSESPLSKEKDYTNVAILHSCYQSVSPEEYRKISAHHDVYRYNIYVEGVGTDALNTTLNDPSWRHPVIMVNGRGLGGGKTGLVALVSKAVAMVQSTLEKMDLSDSDEVHFDVFGFSRGAACARCFSYLAVRGNGSRIGCEDEFAGSQAGRYFEGGFLHFLDKVNGKKINIKVTVDFLGLFDTVSSMGFNYDNDVNDYGLFSPNENGVKNTFHLCAMDEFRSHYALTDIGDAAAKGNNAEFFLPGCHSDIGGGYVTKQEEFYLKYNNENIIDGVVATYKMPVEKPESRNVIKKEISEKTLSDLGWYSYGTLVEKKHSAWNNNSYITYPRDICCGYSNLPFRMMASRANAITQMQKFYFNEHPIPVRFPVPRDKFLSAFVQKMISKALNANGRHWFYPDDQYNSETYRQLRKKYLHFSSNDSAGEWWVGNEAGLNGDTLCRKVYSGNKGASKPMFMCDYS